MAGTLFGFIRDINERKENAQIEDVMRKNFLTNPNQAMEAIFQIDPQKGMVVQQTIQQREEAARKQALDATKAATGFLRAAPEGTDYGATIDKMAPFLQNALKMAPDDIVKWRDAIVANPAMITSLDEDANKERAKFKYGSETVAAGAAQTQGGKEIYRAPYKPEVITARRGDGGVDLVPHDPNTGAIGGATTMPGAPAAPEADTPYAGPAGGSGIPPTNRGGAAPLSVRNNNPGAMRDDGRSKWRGMVGKDANGFVIFDTPENGRRAQMINLMNQKRLHGIDTIGALVQKYAPPNENDTGAYARRVAEAIGVGVNDKVNLADPAIAGRVADIMAVVESGGHKGTYTSRAAGAPAAAPQAGGAAYSTPGKPVKAVRAATPEELAGYPAGTMAQVDETGKLVNLKTPPAGAQTQAGKVATKQAADFTSAQGRVASISDGLDDMIAAAEDLVNNPDLGSYTGSLEGRLPSFLSQGRDDFNANLDALKTKVGMNALQTMREMSKTGGALGNVSNYENKMLQRSLAALETSQSEAQFKKNLAEVMRVAKRAKKRLNEGLARLPRGNAGGTAAPAASSSGPAVGTVAHKKDANGKIISSVRFNGRNWEPVR